MEWKKFKLRVMKTLQEHINEGKVDREILSILKKINSFPFFVTLSSCAGRICVIDVPRFGEKKACKFLGKWHRSVSTEEIVKTVENGLHEVWLLAQPPILHVACKTLEDAKVLLVIANESGLRDSGIISLKKNIVRITSSERIETLLALNKKVFVNKEYIAVLVKKANEKLLRGREKLRKFEKKIEEAKEKLLSL